MITHNSYFDDKVQSVGSTRNGRRFTVGIIAEGEYHFGTDAAERMSVTGGELHVKRDGSVAWLTYSAGTSFEVGVKSGFTVKSLGGPAAYLCEYL